VVCNSSTYWNMVYIWTTNYLLRYININTILINILKLEPDFFRTRRLVLYRHIMSPTDRSSFQHLANYLSAGSRLSANEILCPMFRDIHVAHNTSLIYILHQTLLIYSSTRYYRSCTQNLRHLQFRCIHLAPKTLWSTIPPHIGTWSTFGPQIIYYNTLI
jgi:hypothetical protein